VLHDSLTLRQIPRSYRGFRGTDSWPATWLHITCQLSSHPTCTCHHGSTRLSSTTSADTWPPCHADVIVWEKYPIFFPILLTSKITQIQNFFLGLPLKFGDFNSWFISCITHEFSKNFHRRIGDFCPIFIMGILQLLLWPPLELVIKLNTTKLGFVHMNSTPLLFKFSSCTLNSS
jgi:hypothetical protein